MNLSTNKPIVVILGAGISGLSSGWLLKNKNIDFVILERLTTFGGLARSFEWHNFFCDFATHRLFTSNEAILNRLLNLVPMGRHIRRSRIYFREHWIRDPLDIIELSLRFSLSDKAKILAGYLTRPQGLSDVNFENYVTRRYGQSLYALFFQPYTEKLFGIPGDQISVHWARQKVRLANPLDTIRENTKTKFQYFYYPIQGGYGAIADQLNNEVKDHIIFNAEVVGLETNKNKITNVHYKLDDKYSSLPVQAVISTIPISRTAGMLHHPIHLEFQKVDAVYLYINRPQVTDYHWIYFFDTDIAINRLVEFKNLSPANTPPETTVICAEVTQHHDDVINKVINDLTKVGLVRKEEILDTKAIREDYAYPIYKRDYEKELEIAETFIKQYDNIYLVGRSAQFTHFEVDDNLEEAVKTIEVISKSIPKSDPKPIKSTAMRNEYDYPVIYAVLLTYNHYEDTEECLRSLFTSEFQDLRVVVVDNASSDGTPEKIRQSFPEVHVIENKQNLGVPAGYNIGFEHALKNSADYILMLNNDTILDSQMISQLLEVAENDPEAGVLMPSVMYYEKKDQIWSSGGHYRSFPPSILLRDKRASINDPVHLIEYAPSCGLLIHRRAFERVGLFDPGYFFWYDDWDFSERLRTHGLHIWSVPYARMWHKVSRTTQGLQSELFWKTYGTSITRFYRRHGRPVWFSLPIHIGYIALREFIWKRNWKYLPLFWKGIVEGMQKPLGDYQNPTL